MEISLAHIREAQLQYIHYIPVQVLVIPTWFIMSPLYTHDIIITTHKLRKFLMNPYFGRVNLQFFWAISTTSICFRGPPKIDRIPHGCFTGNPNPRPNKTRTSRFVAEVPPKIPIYRWLKSIKIPLKHYFLSMFDS